MIKLNDYLYNGDTVLKILQKYSDDLRRNAQETHNRIDLAHSNFLVRILNVLEHNDFLTSQSQRIREFYKFMAETYPFLAFTFKGRIKSLIRSEEKFNGYIVEYIYDYHQKHGTYPPVTQLIDQTQRFRDLIAYRIVISMPVCHLKNREIKPAIERKYLFEIANAMPSFLEERGFSAQLSGLEQQECSDELDESVRPFYRDYVVRPKNHGYQSLHITFYDTLAECSIEVQLRTKEMDDYAEIGEANHSSYEAMQADERARRDVIPVGECSYFDEAYERVTALQQLDLSQVDVSMFAAANNFLMNDGCGLYRGRLILPYEHLSRFQNDLVD